MEKKKRYRNAIRYHNLIREAFLTLLKEKPMGKISVTDVVNTAGINRSTFYSHYPDIHGIVEEFQAEFVERMMSVLSNFDYSEFLKDPMPLLWEFNNCLEDKEDIYRLFYQVDDIKPYLESLKDIFNDFILTHPTIPKELRASKTFELRIYQFSGGITNMYQQWLMGKLQCTSQDIVMEVGHLIKKLND